MRINKRKFVIGVVLLGLVLLGWYFLNLKSLTVNYKNATNVVIYKTSDLDSEEVAEPIKKLEATGQTVKLRSGDYTIYYDAAKGYESKYTPVTIKEKGQIFSLIPGRSDEYAEDQLTKERSVINQTLGAKFANINLYDIQPGRLYEDGEWYGTTLFYKGGGILDRDALRVVLHKENNTWVVKTHPEITLSKHVYPKVPVDILRDVNTMPSNITGSYRNN